MSLNLATGQSDVHVPHWKHLRIFSPPCIRESSYLNLGSISEAFIGSLNSLDVAVFSVTFASPLAASRLAPCVHRYSKSPYQLHKVSVTPATFSPYQIHELESFCSIKNAADCCAEGDRPSPFSAYCFY